jgi:hypothetical protein
MRVEWCDQDEQDVRGTYLYTDLPQTGVMYRGHGEVLQDIIYISSVVNGGGAGSVW